MRMSSLTAIQLHRIATLTLSQRATLARLLSIDVSFTYAIAIARNA